MTAEQWRPIPGFPGYEVSNLGRVLSRRQRRTGRILQGSVNSNGYLCVGLYRDGKLTIHGVHRKVAEAFLGPRPEGYHTRHLDGVKLNCALSNLAYGTASENVLDQIRHGVHHLANRTHCKRGHAFDAANTYRASNRHRQCRACKRLWETDREQWAEAASHHRRTLALASP